MGREYTSLDIPVLDQEQFSDTPVKLCPIRHGISRLRNVPGGPLEDSQETLPCLLHACAWWDDELNECWIVTGVVHASKHISVAIREAALILEG